MKKIGSVLASELVQFCVFFYIISMQLQPAIIFGSKYSTIKIDPWAACIIEHPLYIEQGVVTLKENGVITGAPIIFDNGTDNGTVIDNGNKLKLTGIINPSNDSVILNGNCNFYGRNGACLQPIFVSGKNNLISGSLAICNDITLQDSNTSVSIDMIPNLNANIYLNGGSLYLMENSLKFNDGFRFFGPGTVYESGSKFIFGGSPLMFNENLYFVDAEDLHFSADVILEATWTFSGSATIIGNSNILCLKNGKIFVERGSSLLIQNMALHDIHDGNLFCLDNNATLTLQNVTIYLDNDYTFSIGQLVISNQVTILGESKFIYQSQRESTILSRSTLTLDTGITFSYDSLSRRKDLIVFQDPYSTLELDGATLHATMPGMQLTNGCLLISRNSCLSSETSSSENNNNIDEGITFGDDAPQDDLYCDIVKGATLNVIQGSLKYANTLDSSLNMESTFSNILINNGCNFYLYENLNLGVGQITLMGGNFYYIPGKNIFGSTNAGGTINYVEL
jgi:hypothetical protein